MMRSLLLSFLVFCVFLGVSCESGTAPDGISTIEIDGVRDSVFGGETFRLTARALNARGQQVPTEIVWSTSDSTVAAVSPAGFVVSQALGIVTITAAAGDVVRRVSLRVVQSPIAPKLTITGMLAGMLVLDSVRLSSVVTGWPIQPAMNIAWSSMNPSVATVDSMGLVHVLAEGNAIIVARSGALADTARFVATTMFGITLQADKRVAAVGDTVLTVATAYGSYGLPTHPVIVRVEFTYSSSDTMVATVDASGLVRARSSGVVTITASSHGFSGTLDLTAYRSGTGPCAAAGTVHTNVGPAGPQRWSRAGSPHHVPVGISFTDTLTIEPGAVVCSAPGARLSFSNPSTFPPSPQSIPTLVAVGTATAPITFTSEDPAVRWGGISIGEGTFVIAGASRIAHATIEYAVTGVGARASMVIDSVHVRQSGIGMNLGPSGHIVSHSVIDSCETGIRLNGGKLVQNVIRGAVTGVTLGGGTSNTGSVEIFGGRIEGSKGTGLVAPAGFRQSEIVGGSPVRIVGGAGIPALLSAGAFIALYPTLADQDSLLGNAKDEVGLKGGFGGREMVISPKLAWSVGGYDVFDSGFTVSAGGVVRMLPGAKLTNSDDHAMSFQDGSRLIAVGNSAQPVTIAGKRFVFTGSAPVTSVITNARLDGASIISGETHVMLIDSTVATGGGAIVLESPGSRITNSTVDGGDIDWRFPRPASLVLGARGVRADGVKVRGSLHDGIRISSPDVTVTHCEVSASAGDGISATEADNVHINDCNLERNAGAGVSNASAATLDAKLNWWGDPVGPTGPNGDGVSGKVDYMPFRSLPLP